MKDNREADVRDEVLTQLAAAFPDQVPLARLVKTARRAGFDYSAEEMHRAAAFLAGLTPPLATLTHDPATNLAKYAATSAGVAQHENG